MIFLSASVKATIHLDNGENVPWSICESFNLWERGAIGHSNIVKIMNSEADNTAIAEAGEKTIDALRGALGDNPCVLVDHSNDRYYFSDPDLARAFLKALNVYKENNNV